MDPTYYTMNENVFPYALREYRKAKEVNDQGLFNLPEGKCPACPNVPLCGKGYLIFV